MTEYTKDLLKNLQMVSQASRAFFMQKGQRFNGQQKVLNILASQDGLTQAELGEILDIKPSSVAELIKKLEKAALIERKADENDGRIKRVYLTKEGRLKAVKDSGTQNDQSAEFFAGLTEEEQKQFGEYLEKIRDGWDPKFQEKIEFSADPFERLQEMKQMRGIEREFGDMPFNDLNGFSRWKRQARREFRGAFPKREDFKEMTNEQREALRQQMWDDMQKTMGDQFGHRGPGGRGGHRGPGAPKGRGRQGRNMDRTNSNRTVNPDDTGRDIPRDDDANWKDF
jgi:DNA-binding MarR family transcriptional regulator